MNEPVWLERHEVLAVHAELLDRFGGLNGVRDEGMLDAALDRPRNRFAYEEPPPELPTMAAAYAAGIVGNHPFLDGNKRTGFVAAALFLEANGLQFIAPEEEAVERTLALAARAIPESAYADWLGRSCESR
ncbi:MAG: type II toxin-antitoxin system death-on-curing family toxin [Opitutales bacterium]|nr:type II toxin-antitoxin system death-on-curing family toxin [Opitutales bacterium]